MFAFYAFLYVKFLYKKNKKLEIGLMTSITLYSKKDIIDNAKMKELSNWKNYQVYTEVEDKNQAIISTRWVITTKVIGEDKIIKARLVPRGFQDEEIKKLPLILQYFLWKAYILF